MPNRKQYWRGIQGVLGLTALVISLAACGTPAPTVSPADQNQLTAQAAVSGLTGQYFDNSDFTGASQTRVDTTVNFNWGSSAPITGIQPTTYSVRWTGQIQAPTTEEYTFYVTSSGGARLTVNGLEATNNWTDHSAIVNSGKIKLAVGQKVDIKLEYFRNTINPGSIKLEWQSVNRTRQVIPSANLFSNGSNVATLVANLQSSISTTINADTVNGRAIYLGNGVAFLWVPDLQKAAFITAAFKNGVVKFARYSDLTNIKLKVTNLLNNKVTDFGDLTTFRGMNNGARWLIERKLYDGLENSNPPINGSTRLGTRSVPSGLCPLCLANLELYALDQAAFTLLVADIEADVAYVIVSAASPGTFIANLTSAVKEVRYLAWYSLANEVKGVVGATGWLGQFQQFFDSTLKSNAEWQNCLVTAKCDPKISEPTPNPLNLDGSSGASVTASFDLKNIGGSTLGFGTSSSAPWLTVTSNVAAGLEQNEVKSVGISARCPTDATSAPLLTGTITITATSSLDFTYREVKTETVTLKCPPTIKFVPDYVRMKINSQFSRIQSLNVETTGLGGAGITWGVLGGPWPDLTYTTPKIFQGSTTYSADFVRPRTVGLTTVTATAQIANGPKATADIDVGYDATLGYTFGGARLIDSLNEVLSSVTNTCRHTSHWEISANVETDLTKDAKFLVRVVSPSVTVGLTTSCTGYSATVQAYTQQQFNPQLNAVLQVWKQLVLPDVAATVGTTYTTTNSTPGFQFDPNSNLDVLYSYQFRADLRASWKR